jgi:hypothetical protein
VAETAAEAATIEGGGQGAAQAAQPELNIVQPHALDYT